MTADLTAVLESQRPDVLAGDDPRGLLHDVGHGLATLTYLVDGLREDPEVTTELSGRLDLVGRELSRLVQLVDLRSGPAEPVAIDARPVLEEHVAQSPAAPSNPVVLPPTHQVLVRTHAG